MARRKAEERNIRKLTRIGNKSIGVTLPIDFVHKLGWRKGQKVVIKKTGKRLIISDWE